MASKGELLRQRIVSAADQLFYQQGYANTSFSDIASAVDISRGNFYYHFKSKDKILNAVIDKRCVDIKEMLSDWEHTNNSEQNILLYIDTLFSNHDNIKNHGCPVGSMCTELSKINHFMHTDAIKMHKLFRDWLTTQFEQLGHDKKNAQQLAMHLLARGQGIAAITSSFEDDAFLQQEVEMLRGWVNEVVSRKS